MELNRHWKQQILTGGTLPPVMYLSLLLVPCRIKCRAAKAGEMHVPPAEDSAKCKVPLKSWSCSCYITKNHLPHPLAASFSPSPLCRKKPWSLSYIANTHETLSYSPMSCLPPFLSILQPHAATKQSNPKPSSSPHRTTLAYWNLPSLSPCLLLDFLQSPATQCESSKENKVRKNKHTI